MPQNSKFVSVDEVIKFFDEEIDGMGKRGGHPRNQEVPGMLRLCCRWEFRELSEEEFLHLIIPDNEKPLQQT